jgi:apolipoprotein N-acyltransferase
MSTMTDRRAATLPTTPLSGIGQLYVTTVGAVAVLTLVEGSEAWYVALVVLSLPLSLLALWVAFYAGLAVGAGQLSWPAGIVWVLVWTATAWINAQVLQKVLRRGWRTIAPRPVEDIDDD